MIPAATAKFTDNSISSFRFTFVNMFILRCLLPSQANEYFVIYFSEIIVFFLLFFYFYIYALKNILNTSKLSIF